MINDSLKKELLNRLKIYIDSDLVIEEISRENGGDINDCFKIVTNKGSYFIKVNNARKYPKMFQMESNGLQLLSNHSSFYTPTVFFELDHNNWSILLMEYLHLRTNGSWDKFGRSLADLHQVDDPHFGLDQDNYIGSLTQSNKKHETWASFYKEERISPLFKEAFDKGFFGKRDLVFVDKLDFDKIFPVEKPALLHGDLWSGNAAFCKGKPCIYDPAVYYGHREMDLGMTLLFGGFPQEMYAAYEEVFPLEKGWKQRVEIAQLYPLLVHVLLFGGSYIQQVRTILQRS